jgi:hypothetical protein
MKFIPYMCYGNTTAQTKQNIVASDDVINPLAKWNCNKFQSGYVTSTTVHPATPQHADAGMSLEVPATQPRTSPGYQTVCRKAYSATCMHENDP